MKPENVACPTCGGPMVSRMNRAKNQRFWGCKAYPECKGTRNTDGEAPRQRDDPEPGDRDERLPSQRRDQRGWNR